MYYIKENSPSPYYDTFQYCPTDVKLELLKS